MKHKLSSLMALALVSTAILTSTSTSALASGSGGGGGGGGSTETIRFDKCFFIMSYPGSTSCQILMKAASTNTSAHLYAYLPTGEYLGEVPNTISGRIQCISRYSPYLPDHVIMVSSTGATASAVPVPYVPGP